MIRFVDVAAANALADVAALKPAEEVMQLVSPQPEVTKAKRGRPRKDARAS